MPITASSPSIRTHSCSLVYFRSGGFTNSPSGRLRGISLSAFCPMSVKRYGGDSGGRRPTANLDLNLGAYRAIGVVGNVCEADGRVKTWRHSATRYYSDLRVVLEHLIALAWYALAEKLESHEPSCCRLLAQHPKGRPAREFALVKLHDSSQPSLIRRCMLVELMPV